MLKQIKETLMGMGVHAWERKREEGLEQCCGRAEGDEIITCTCI
jgi:hypothetical protein